MQIAQIESSRKCEECTSCCEGWLTANIYGHVMRPGTKCHFLGKTCTIYQNRPEDVCKAYKCVWLEDTNYSLPEWLKPSLSKIIITKRPWGKNKENIYWSVVECGEKMRAEILHWLIMYCESNSINLEYQFDNQMHRRGSKEFNDYMNNIDNT